MMRTSLTLLAALASFLVACAPDPLVGAGGQEPRKTKEALTVIDVSDATAGAAPRGLSLSGDALELVVDGKGIVRVDRDGHVLAEHKLGEQGLPAFAYNDVSAKDNGAFVLIADPEGYLWDPATEAFSVHFCVEPGWEEPIVIQQNDALAANDNLIVAAPRFYEVDPATGEAGALNSSVLRTYRASTGEPLSWGDLTEEGLELQGVAIDGETVLGVSGYEIVRLDIEGNVLETLTLEGIEDATGLAVDLNEGKLLVLDAADSEVRLFEL